MNVNSGLNRNNLLEADNFYQEEPTKSKTDLLKEVSEIVLETIYLTGMLFQSAQTRAFL